jgi:hypothetical protein
MFVSAMSQIQDKVRLGSAESTSDNPYAELLRGTKKTHSHWERWKSGYGIIS